MQKVYVTEGGAIDKHGFFDGRGVIGVDFEPKSAVGYPVKEGCYRYKSYRHSSGFVIVYKSPYSARGYRVTQLNAY